MRVRLDSLFQVFGSSFRFQLAAKGRRQSPEKKQQQLAGRQGGGGAEKEAEGRQAEGQEAEEERVGTRGWRGEAVVDDMGTLAFLKFAFWWSIIAASSSVAVTVSEG